MYARIQVMSLISETLMSIKRLEYVAFDVMTKKLCEFCAALMHSC